MTRVGVESSELPEKTSGAGVSKGGAAQSGGGGDDCRTRDFIAKFSIVVAFDAAPVPLTSESEGALATATESAAATSADTSSESEGSEGG